MAKGMESLKSYHQALVSKVPQDGPTNLAKVREVMQGLKQDFGRSSRGM